MVTLFLALAAIAVAALALAAAASRAKAPGGPEAFLTHADRVLAGLPDAAALVDATGRAALVNSRLASLLHVDAGEAQGKRIDSLLAEAGFPGPLQLAAASGEGMRAEGDVHRDGSQRSYEVVASPLDVGQERSAIVVVRDVTEFRAEERHLAHLATHDALTGMPNRRSLEQALEHVVARAGRGVSSQILYIDIDDFKIMNDMLGHQWGDDLLVSIAGLVREHVRGGDTAARLGGDEFAVVLEDIAEDDARAIAERIRDSANGLPRPEAPGKRSVTVSVGMAAIERGDTASAVLDRADAAMYRSKGAGGDAVTPFDPAVDLARQRRQAADTLTRLKTALAEGAFELHFQPVVRLKDGSVAYHEALLRLPLDGELVPPREFLPTAERYRLMPEVTAWVVDRVFGALGEHPHAAFALNLSQLDLLDPAFMERLSSRLATSRVSPSRLVLEIPEAAVVADLRLAEARIREIKNLGVTITLDGFGSGAGSLDYLRSLPVDRVKVHAGHVRAMTDERTWALRIDVVQQLAGSRGMTTVVQGVEDEHTALALRGIGVTYAQGFHFGRPVPGLAEEAAALTGVAT